MKQYYNSIRTKAGSESAHFWTCVAGEAHRHKKAAMPGQGRAKKLKVVFLSSIPSSIPKGSRRES